MNDALTIPQLWERLPLSGKPPVRDGQRFCSPFRPDRHPDCYLSDDLTCYHDWAAGVSRTGPMGFLALALGLPHEATQRTPTHRAALQSWLDGHGGELPPRTHPVQTFETEIPYRNPAYLACRLTPQEPDRIEKATLALAKSRKLPLPGVRLAVERGLVIFGHKAPPQRIRPFWGLYDGVSETLSVRRMDRLDWPGTQDYPPCKAKTPAGWGHSPPRFWGIAGLRERHALVLLVEGEGDYLAAHCLLSEGVYDPETTAVVAAQSCHARFSALDLLHLRNRAVVAFPQRDARGQSAHAVQIWESQLKRTVHGFVTEPEPTDPLAKDLNDVVSLAEAAA